MTTVKAKRNATPAAEAMGPLGLFVVVILHEVTGLELKLCSRSFGGMMVAIVVVAEAFDHAR